MIDCEFGVFVACYAVTSIAVFLFMFKSPPPPPSPRVWCRRCGIWLVPGKEDATCAACQAEEKEGR